MKFRTPFQALHGVEKLLQVCTIGWKFHEQKFLKLPGIEPYSVSGYETSTPTNRGSRQDTFLGAELDIVLSADPDNLADSKKQLLGSRGLDEDFIQPA